MPVITEANAATSIVSAFRVLKHPFTGHRRHESGHLRLGESRQFQPMPANRVGQRRVGQPDPLRPGNRPAGRPVRCSADERGGYDAGLEHAVGGIEAMTGQQQIKDLQAQAAGRDTDVEPDQAATVRGTRPRQ